MQQTFEAAIERRASVCGLTLASGVAGALAAHMQMVLEQNPVLHLTSITDPDEFIDRHLGEAFEGSVLFDTGDATGDERGLHLDIGTGNGYPAFPFAAAHPALELVLVEASARKAFFLRELRSIEGLPRFQILEQQVQRASDLEPFAEEGTVRAMTVRAVGGWPRLLPKLARCLEPERGRLLLWAGDDVEPVAARASWRKALQRVGRHAIPGRERSWIWAFARA